MAQICVVWPTPIGDARIQNDSHQVILVRRAQHKRSLGLKLPAAGQDDDVFQKAQRAGLAAILIVDFAVYVIRIGELDQPRARLEIAVIPPLENQPRSRAFPDEPGKNIERSPACGASGAIMNCRMYRRNPYSVSTGSS